MQLRVLHPVVQPNETCGRRETFSPFFSSRMPCTPAPVAGRGAEQPLLALVPERALLFGRKATPWKERELVMLQVERRFHRQVRTSQACRLLPFVWLLVQREPVLR